MALKYYKNKKTGEVVRSLKSLNNNDFEELLHAPNQKFMVSAGDNKSKIKDLRKQLTERSRNHSRDHLLDDTIQKNLKNGLDSQVAQNFLNNKGTRRTKLDDI